MYKFIVVEDIGRNLNAIGMNFKSPILKPSKFSTDVIGKLLAESRVTKMYEVYEKDASLRVKLTATNYKSPFEVLWAAENPGMVFPYANTVTEVPKKPVAPITPPAPKAPAVTPVVPTTPVPPATTPTAPVVEIPTPAVTAPATPVTPAPTASVVATASADKVGDVEVLQPDTAAKV